MATRRERVVLDVESNVSASMARDAAATALLKRELNSLSRTAVDTRGGLQGVNNSSSGLPALGRNADRSGSSINQLSGRLAILVKTAAALGPAFVPITVSAVPALAGLTTQIGFAVAAGGTAIIAFQGVGDALKALNDAHLKPTTANLEKAQIAMEKLSPEAQEFVHQLRDMGPALREVRDSAAGGLFPGLTEGMESVETLLPKVERIMRRIGEATGDLFADGAQSLAGPEWAEFFDFIEAEAQPTLSTMGHTVGNLTKGLAELWMALDPMSDDFSQGLLQASQRFEDWAEGLEQTEGFQEFLAYVRDTGPHVLDTLGAIGNAFLQIGEAAAPLGGPVLQILEALANVIADIADSPLGTPIMAAVAAMSALSLASGVFNRAGGQAWKTNISGANGYVAAMASARRATAVGAAGLGLLALSLTDVDEKAGLSNTANLALMGTLISPGWGTAIGAGVGGLMDLTSAYSDLSGEIGRADDALASNDLDALMSSLAELQTLRAMLSFGGDGGGILSGFLNGTNGDADEVANKAKMVEAAIWALKTSGDNGAHTFNQILGPALGQTARSLDIATASTEEFRAAFETLNNALSGRASWRDYEAAIDAVAAALKANGKTLDITTEKGRANQTALDSIAATSIKVAETLEGMDRVRFLKRARQDFINAAVALGLSIPKAEALAEKLGLLNTRVTKPKVDDKDLRRAVRTGDDLLDRMLNIGIRPPAKPKVDKSSIDSARTSAGGVLGALSLINGYEAKATISITRIAHDVFGGGDILKPPVAKADGGTIPGQRQPYGDKVLMWGAPGEEVITNAHGEADAFRRDRAAGRIPAYADGGEVRAAQRWRAGSRTGSHTMQTIRLEGNDMDYDRMGRAFAHALADVVPELRLVDAGQGAYLSGADF